MKCLKNIRAHTPPPPTNRQKVLVVDTCIGYISLADTNIISTCGIYDSLLSHYLFIIIWLHATS